MNKEKWHEAEVIKIAELTANIHRFWLKVKDVSVFDFNPGQFVTLDLPIGEKLKDRWRSYSIASPPFGDSDFELVVMNLQGGKGSDFLFHETKVGSTIKFNGPLGKFLLPDKIENDLCFICTGTGITPFRSMLLHLSKKKQVHKNIYLFFGTRCLKDVLFREELEQLQKTFPHFTYKFVLSKEESSEYNGLKGHVHQLYESEFSDKRKADFYICGWKGMINEARERLHAMGYASKKIHLEVYD